MAKVVKGIGKVVGSVVKAGVGLVGMLFKQPKQPKASANVSTETRLNGSLVPEEHRKIIFGETACGTDERFWETYGANNNQHVKVYAAAGHEVTAFGNLYLDEYPIPFNGNAASDKYAGQLTRRAVLKGVSGAGLTLGSGTRWTPAASMTGCAYFVLDWVYNQEKMTNGIPSRITQVVKGAKVFDPRRWTIYGGTHDPANPDTWEYTPLDPNGQPIGRNNALQMLTYELGIKVRNAQTNKWVKIGGRGVEIADIDFDSFIVAANNCELERWYSDCILSTGDDHATNEAILEAASGGELVDVGGRFSYFVSVDDTADIAAYLTESDIVGPISWTPQEPIAAQFNELPGSFVDPAALFQTRPLPLCFDQAYYDQDGYEKRGEPLKLSAVQDPVQGQKLQRRKLNKSRFQGVFAAPFNLKGLRVRPWSNVRLTFEPFGWNNKLFRVKQQGIGTNGGIQLVLREEDASIYTPGAVVNVPPPSVGFGGNSQIKIPVTGLNAIASGITTNATARDTINAVWDLAPQIVKHTEIRFKKVGETYWQTAGPLRRDQNFVVVQEVVPLTQYEFEVRHVSLWDVPGDWNSKLVTTNAVTKNSAGQLVYADGTTVESLKPAGPNANNTQSNIAAGITGQGWGATASEAQARNSLIPVGQNRVINSDLPTANPGNQANFLPKGFVPGWGGNGPVGPANWDVSFNNAKQAALRVNFSPNANTASGTIFDNSNVARGDADANGFRRYGVQVKPGDRVAFAARLAKFESGQTEIIGTWFAADGSYITEFGFDTGRYNGADINGNETHPRFWPRVYGFATAPANAAYAGMWQRTFTDGRGTPHAWMTEPFIAVVPADQTVVPAYGPGPSDRFVDKTGENISSGIVGQGPGATGTADQVLNDRVRVGVNSIVDSDMVRGWAAFGTGWNGPVTNSPYRNIEGTAIKFVRGAFAPLITEASVFDLFSTNPRADLGIVSVREYGLPVSLGDRLFASCLAARAAGAGASGISLQVGFYNGNGDYIGEVTAAYGGRDGYVSAQGDPNEFDRIGGFVTVENANARWAVIWARVNKVATPQPADGHSAAAQPMLCKVMPGQLVWPMYQTGPSAKRADPTNENISSGVVGQGPLATANFPYYNGMSAAIAAGLTNGQQFFDTSNGSKLTAVVISSGGGLKASVSTGSISGNRSGAGNVQTTQNVVVTVEGGNAGASIRWLLRSGDSRINMNNPASFNTGAYMNIGIGQVVSAYFEGIVTKGGESTSVFVDILFAENT